MWVVGVFQPEIRTRIAPSAGSAVRWWAVRTALSPGQRLI